MEFILQRFRQWHIWLQNFEQKTNLSFLRKAFIQHITDIKSVGSTPLLNHYDKRKLGVFNLLNFLHIITGLIVPITALAGNKQLPQYAWLIACLPTVVSFIVLFLNHKHKYEEAKLAYFILYPFCACIVYLNGMNLGVDLFFILYGVLAVFFLQDVGYMLFTIGFSMISYFVLLVLRKNYQFQLATTNIGVYQFNQALAILYIYYGLYLIKRENTSYQFRILRRNKALHDKNEEISRQKKELDELNAVKNKLFSVIAHDVKSPVYALRTLFSNAQRYNLSAEEVKGLIPEVIGELNNSINLMENLLQWAKSQMNTTVLHSQEVSIPKLAEEVIQPLNLQARTKEIDIQLEMETDAKLFINKEMLAMVLRNLVSNAIKFTPKKGTITVGINDMQDCVEIYVQDTGIGMSNETLQKINGAEYYTTNGTAGENGTGLGLVLCREFLQKSNSSLHIESKPGEGSVFSFSLSK